jgi:hypothetical protein
MPTWFAADLNRDHPPRIPMPGGLLLNPPNVSYFGIKPPNPGRRPTCQVRIWARKSEPKSAIGSVAQWLGGLMSRIVRRQLILQHALEPV